ncbi:MAG: aminotransferase class V-fold PLP-dependent enzyme [Phycisphaerales bacterium]|nr:aminotransferase class V-fold PLP-dependent enzyme [Phycisphaerales bacterium]
MRRKRPESALDRAARSCIIARRALACASGSQQLSCLLVFRRFGVSAFRRSMIYLDHAATSWPKPAAVTRAMQAFLDEAGGNPGRAGHRRARASQALIETLRIKLARRIGGVEPQGVVFTLNGTDALNIAIKGALRPGDHVVTTQAEHNSVRRPLHGLARRGVIALTTVRADGEGFIDPDDVRRALTPKTRLVACLHVSNVTGTVQPIGDVGAIIREHGDALLLVDAAQSAGLLDVSPAALNADLVAFPGHKAIFGPPGTGVLLVGPRAELEPFREGGTGTDSENPLQPEDLPTRLEAGTPNTVGLAGLSAALDLLDPPSALAHEQRLLRRLIDQLAGHERIRLYGPLDGRRQVGVLSMNLAGTDPQDAAAILDDSFDIAVRPGLHCAPDMHRALGTHAAGALRASLASCTTEAQIDAFVAAVVRIAESTR